MKKKFSQRYHLYFKTDHWQWLRARKLAAQPVCESCKTDKHLQVHHINYKHLIDCELSDLATLCKDCHEHFHIAKTTCAGTNADFDVPKIKALIDWMRYNPQRSPQKPSKAHKPTLPTAIWRGNSVTFKSALKRLMAELQKRGYTAKSTERFIVDAKDLMNHFNLIG